MKMGWCERMAYAASGLVMAAASAICTLVVAACIVTVAPLTTPVFEAAVNGMMGAAGLACDFFTKAARGEKEPVLVHSDKQEVEPVVRPQR
jgi:hypothetical protein